MRRPVTDRSARPAPDAGPTVKVWDVGVRAFHWLLVCAVLVAVLTGFFGAPNTLNIHLIAGSSIVALVGFRLVWGVLGGFYARFSSFAFAPHSVLGYARDLLRGTSRRFLGHNPLGSVMVFALLGVLVLIVSTGVITLGGQDKQGPLAFVMPFAVGWAARSVHQALALLLVVMVLGHLAGVLFESWHERENLTSSMLTGRKRSLPGVSSPRDGGSPWLAAAVVIVLGGAVSAGVVALAARPGLGVPTAPLDADYDRECSACHAVYHPSLLTNVMGQGILDHLSTHFGNDASLSPALVAHLRAYLAANSAEHWDTLPAVMLRESVDPGGSLRITDTGFWRRRHRDIPAVVFADKRVNGRSNCLACHGDADSGRFAPQNINIPK